MAEPSQNISPGVALLAVGAVLVFAYFYATNAASHPHPAAAADYTPPAAAAPAAPPKPSCAASSFTVSKVKYATSSGYVNVTGIVQHSCSIAAGVQLKWTAYNTDGTVAFSDDFWPASTTNIQPNTPFPFHSMKSSTPQIARHELTVSSTNVW